MFQGQQTTEILHQYSGSLAISAIRFLPDSEGSDITWTMLTTALLGCAALHAARVVRPRAGAVAACSDSRDWHEVWLCDAATQQYHKTAGGAAVSCGDAVIVLPDAFTAAECEGLLRLGQQAADRQKSSFRRRASASIRELTSNNKQSIGRTRVPFGTLSATTEAQFDRSFAKVLTLVDDNIPSVTALFNEAEDANLSALHASGDLEFSAREPAINIYNAGGEFNAHMDRQTLTVLVYLTPPDSCVGGGTGFWAQGSSDDEPPTAILSPPAGTALVYGGCVTHAGMPVTSGQRAIFLGSFSTRRADLQLLECD